MKKHYEGYSLPGLDWESFDMEYRCSRCDSEDVAIQPHQKFSDFCDGTPSTADELSRWVCSSCQYMGSGEEFATEPLNLVLNDNGGVWQNHNLWLESIEDEVTVVSKEKAIVISLTRSESNGPWKVDPTPLAIARLHGFEKEQLTKKNSVRIKIDIPQNRQKKLVFNRGQKRISLLSQRKGQFRSDERTLISSGSEFEEAIGYSRAVAQGDWVFVSGTTGYNYDTMQLADGMAEQTQQALLNIEKALHQARAELSDVVRVTYYVKDAKLFPESFPVLKKYFGSVKPAATMVQAQLLNENMLIEIEVTALKQAR